MIMMKAVSSTFTAIVAIIVAIVAVGVGVYSYVEYQNLTQQLSAPPTTTTTSMQKNLLPYDNASKTVFVTIESLNTGNPFNFNGTSNGALIIYIPAGYKLSLTYINLQSLTHNLILLQNSSPTPNNADIAKFGTIITAVGTSASSYQTNGISSGQKDTAVSPTLNQGTYMLVCGILGHAESGMWAVVVVSSSVSQPYYVISS
jgi:sulfocyanin